MARLRLSLLGASQVILDGQSASGFVYSRARALLAYLVVEVDRPHHRDALVGLLWPELPDGVARTNLRQILANLREAIGDARATPPFLLVTRDTLQFNPASNYELDVTDFTALLAACEHHAHRRWERCQSCAVRMEQAMSLYHGDFLEGVGLGGSAPFEEWQLRHRERLHQRALDTLARLATYYEWYGDDALACRSAQRQIELDPWREEAHRRLMRLLARGNQRSAALAQYETCRRILLRDLGVEPDSETTTLYEHIRDGATSEEPGLIRGVSAARGETHIAIRQPQAVRNLPAQTTVLIGRESDLTELGALLENPVCRLLTLVGPGGIGKTRLALAAAEEHAGVFADGAAFIPLAGISATQFVAPAILSALDVALHGQRDPRDQLVEYLRGKELLLVLDNVEQLLAHEPHDTDGIADLLADLQARVPGLTLLVTSRERLALPGEWLFEVSGLSYPRGEAAADVEDYSAVRLFVQRAAQVRRPFALTSAETRAVGRICQLVEGLPLAVELAAAAMRTNSCRAIAAAIEGNLSALAVGQRAVPERHRSILATFEHSWRLLPDRERGVFPRLSVFRGGFQEDAAVHVAGASPQILAALVDKSLLRWDGTGRYTLHELVRQYAGEKLEQTGRSTDIRMLHARYFLERAETIEKRIGRREDAGVLALLEQEYVNMRAALGWAVDQEEAELCLQLCKALQYVWDVRGYHIEGWQWFRAALALPGPVPVGLRARCLAAASGFATEQGHPAVAIPLMEEALTLLQTLGDQADIVLASGALAWARLLAGDYRQAVPMFEECLAWARDAGDVGAVAWFAEGLGRAAYEQGDVEQAKPLLEESLRLYRKREYSFSAAWVLSHASQVALYEGKAEQAISLAEEGQALFRALGSQHGIAWTVGTLGWVALQRDDVAGAVALFKQSLAAFRDLGDNRSIACRLEALAAASVKGRTDPTKAARLFGAAVALREAQGLRLPPADEALYQPYVAAVRTEFDEGAWAAAWAEGQAMTLEQAIAHALEADGS